jgi:hypothetical protein
MARNPGLRPILLFLAIVLIGVLSQPAPWAAPARSGGASSADAVVTEAVQTAAGGETAPLRYFVHVPHVSEDDARALMAQHFDVAGYDFKTGVLGIVATRKELDTLTSMGLAYTVVDVSHPLNAAPEALSDYTDPAEMSAFMDLVQTNYPTLAKKVVVKSGLFDGQVVYAMKITKDVDQPNDRPRFVLDGQHHAREVMTAEITKDAIDYLTARYATDAQVRAWVDSIEIWVVPIVNPDGAAYVFSTDSSWRRNRHPNCPVDLNRNYGFTWNACNGSSASCADDTCRGSAPESEPETQGMNQLFSDVHALFGLSYHSYGEYLMYSYGCNDPDEKAAMNAIAQSLNSILVGDSGTTGGWRTGAIWNTIYLADGGSTDTEYGRHGTYSYVIEVNTTGFQPDYATTRDITVQRQRTAWQFFLDKTLNGPQIRGKVTDALTGSPLAATVSAQEVTFTHGEWPRKADPRGLYGWLVQPGNTYHLTFSMPGYCSQTQTVTAPAGPVTLNIAMTHPPAPAAPAAGAGGDNRIDLSWAPVSGATAYRVLRSLTQGGPYTQVASVTAPTTNYSDSPVSGQVTYYYVVRAVRDCDSPDSTEVSASTTGPCTVPPAFGGIASVATPAGTTCALTLGWTAASGYCGGPTTYRVYRSTTSSFTPSPATLVASGLGGTGWTDHAALAGGATYYYIVRSVDAVSGSEDPNTLTKSGIPTGPAALGTWTDDAGDTGTAKMILTSPWSILATGGRTAPKVYATGTTANNVCASMTTPVLTLGTNAVASFYSKYDLETNFDAGVVEIATEPTFTNWTKLTTVTYPDPLLNSGNACGFATGTAVTAFSKTNTTPTYLRQYAGSLTAFNGKQVRLRWSLSTDGGVNGAGWWVDDIKVTNVMIPGSCATGSAPNPKEVGSGGSGMTCARAGGTTFSVSYTPGCGALDNVVYWGTSPMPGGVAWTGSACGLGNTGLATFDPGSPPAGNFIYFVIVGQNGSKEGSYGQSVNGGTTTEMPEASGVGACDKPQDLSGSCP